jgi:hypothetical protein
MSHRSCCRHKGPKLAGSKSPEACLLVSGYQVSVATAANMGDPSGRRNSGACFLGMGSRKAVQYCCRHRGTKPLGDGSSGADLPVWATRSHNSCCQLRGTKPAGSRSPGTYLLMLTTKSHCSCC